LDIKSDRVQNKAIDDVKQVYSNAVVDHATNPRNVGNITGADGIGSITGPCGDTMEIWLKVNGGKILNATFWTDGCVSTIACGSMVTEMVKGKNITQALAINQNDILKILGGLPEDNHHCALLAANTVKAAIQDYIALSKEPWKKAYRR